MKAEILMGLMVVGISLLTPSAFANYQVFNIWQYNVSLDFGGKNVSEVPQQPVSDINSIMRSTLFRGDSADDWGAIYLFDNREPFSPIMEESLRGLMMPTCKAIWIDSGTIGGLSGLIATSEARVKHGFGQRCYAGIVTISTSGVGERHTFAVIGHFKNETLNQQLVKTARIEHAK